MFKTRTDRAAQRLLVFARVPEQGLVKTRLAATLGAERTLKIYEAMLADLLRSIGDGTDRTEVEVMWTGSSAVGGEQLRRAFGDLPLAMQSGVSLGDRLCIAFTERILFHRAEKIIAIGTDDPLLPRQLVEVAFELLDSCDWVLGPATDGGYYLIGCRAEAFDPEVFQDIDWGTDRVFTETEAKIRRDGYCLALLPARGDIDLEDDLRAFAATAKEGQLLNLLRQIGF